MDVGDFFRGKRVLVMGLGLLGRGVGDIAFLAEKGATVTVTDLKTREALASSLESLSKYPGIIYRLGEHVVEDFTQNDMVIKAAGVPLDSPYIAAAREAGVPVYMSTALFAKFAMEGGATIVGITGTRGKSTTTNLIYQGLLHAGKNVHIGGNVRGVSTISLLPYIQKNDIVVLELDSWQLQGFGDLSISPHVSVFTNLMPDHLNYYKGDMEAYFMDKAQIFLHQKAGNYFFVGATLFDQVASVHPTVSPVVPPAIPEEWTLLLMGEHNRENAALAAAALRALGVSENLVREGIEQCAPVEGRLQYMGIAEGKAVYNDNNATTPDATLAGLHSFEGKKVTLIVGGADKNIPLERLADACNSNTVSVVLLPGTGTERFKPLLARYEEAMSMQEAVEKALALPGDMVLFSPGFASFGLFTNEYDRNDQFVQAVEQRINHV